jgi:hypothetical protein
MKLTRYIFAFVSLLIPQCVLAAPLWYGGEDTSTTFIGTVAIGTSNTGPIWDGNFARETIVLQNGTSISDPPANRFTPGIGTFSNQTDFWIHWSIGFNGTITTTNNEQALIIRSPDGVGRVYLLQTGTGGQLKLSVANAARSFTDKATATSNFASGVNIFDLHVQYTCSGSDTATLYLNSISILTYTGSLCTDAATALNAVEFAAFNNSAFANTAGSNFSELEISASSTLSDRIYTIGQLVAAGNTQGWTPNTLGNVNKQTINDSTFVSDGTGNVLSQWTTPTTAPAGTWGVKSVSIEARVLRNSSGPQNLDWSFRIANSDYLAGTTTALTPSFVNYRRQQDTSLATSTTWTITEVFNTSSNELNIGIKSLP